MSPKPIDHRDVMMKLAVDNNWRRGLELGVGSGLLFARLVGVGVEMTGVDMGVRPDRVMNVRAFVAAKQRQGHRCSVLWESTDNAHKMLPDGHFDFVFIDAGHSYEAVRKDIANYRSKVKPGGWFGGHDYHPKFPGVIRAVGEAFGADVEVLGGWIWHAK